MKMYCNWCSGVSDFEFKDLKKKQLGSRMASGLFGYCKYCKAVSRMHPVNPIDAVAKRYMRLCR